MLKIGLTGDKEKALSLVPFAKLQMLILQQAMKFQNLSQDIRRVFLQDGSTVEATSRFGQDSVLIYGKPSDAIEEELLQPLTYIRYIAIKLSAVDPAMRGLIYRNEEYVNMATRDWLLFCWIYREPQLPYMYFDDYSPFPYATQLADVWTVWDAKLNCVAEIPNADGTDNITFPCLYEDLAHWLAFEDVALSNFAETTEWLFDEYWPSGLPTGYPPFDDIDIGSPTPAHLERYPECYWPGTWDDVYWDSILWSGIDSEGIPFSCCMRLWSCLRHGITDNWYIDPVTGISCMDGYRYYNDTIYTPIGYFTNMYNIYTESKYYAPLPDTERNYYVTRAYRNEWIHTSNEPGEDDTITPTSTKGKHYTWPKTCLKSSTIALQIYGYYHTWGFMTVDTSPPFDVEDSEDWADAYFNGEFTHLTEMWWLAACDYNEEGESLGIHTRPDIDPSTQERNIDLETALGALSAGLWELNGLSIGDPLVKVRIQIRPKPEEYIQEA